MDFERLQQKIRDLEEEAAISRERFEDMKAWLSSQQQETLDIGQSITQSLDNRIQSILRQQQAGHLQGDVLWKNPKPTMRVGYNNLKPSYPSSTPQLAERISNQKLTLTFSFTNTIHCYYNSVSVYDSSLKTCCPNKFKLNLYIFGEQFSTEFLTIVDSHIYKWKEYTYLNRREKANFQYSIDLGNSFIPNVQYQLLSSNIQVVCLDPAEFVLGVAEVDIGQVVERSLQHQSFPVLFDLQREGREYLKINVTVNPLVRDSEVTTSEENSQEQIECFYNKPVLIPILLTNNLKYPKSFTLEYQCKYSTLTFVTSNTEFNRLNRIPALKFQPLKLLSQNVLQLQPGDQIIVYLVLHIENLHQGRLQPDNFLLHTMGINYNVDVREYLHFELIHPSSLFDIPNHKYISYNGVSFFHNQQKIQVHKLNGICGQYLKLDLAEKSEIFPDHIEVASKSDRMHVCCYSNSVVASRIRTENKLTIWNIEVADNKGVNTIYYQRTKLPQEVDFVECQLPEGRYKIVSSNEGILKILARGQRHWTEEQRSKGSGFKVWIEMGEGEQQCLFYVSNMESLKTVPVLMKPMGV